MNRPINFAALAHDAEAKGNWLLAASCWAAANNPVEAAACMMLEAESPSQPAEAN